MMKKPSLPEAPCCKRSHTNSILCCTRGKGHAQPGVMALMLHSAVIWAALALQLSSALLSFEIISGCGGH